MTFLLNGRYDLSAIVRDAHRRAKKMRLPTERYMAAFRFYLGQVWLIAKYEMINARCTGATVTVAKAFDNGGSPLWRL